MKDAVKCSLRAYLSTCLAGTRKELNLTQEKFSGGILIDTRSYSSLEHGTSLCCTLTFIIYLCYVCKDTASLIDDLRKVMDNVFNNTDCTQE